MSDTDIVTRLRRHIAITTRIHFAKDGYPEPVYSHGPSPICQEAAEEIERLRVERDEARRKICEMEAECIVYPPCSPQQYAVRMGWDCFKEETL